MWLENNFPLKQHNSFGVPAYCRFMLEVRHPDDLATYLEDPSMDKYERLVLGGGSNILFTKDFDGTVIKIAIAGVEIVKEQGDTTWVRVGAGENWHGFVLECIENGLSGVENLSLIPGLVGGAPIQNIGAYGVEFEQVFDSLETIHLRSGEKRIFRHEDCRFGYRDSIFKNAAKGQHVITHVTLKLCAGPPELNLSYGAIEKTLEEMGVEQPTAKDVSDAVIRIRQSKLPNPEEVGNAGSFFKNPIVEKSFFNNLQKDNPDIPSYPAQNGHVKIPAAWMIEQCGWKGKREGDAGVFPNHALVLVNYGDATGEDIRNLSASIQASVKDRFGLQLHPEVNII